MVFVGAGVYILDICKQFKAKGVMMIILSEQEITEVCLSFLGLTFVTFKNLAGSSLNIFAF